VVATTGMIADVAREVAGDCAHVTAIMKPGVDPHLYKARPSDVRAFYRADLILYSGYHLEGQLAEVLEAFGRRKPVLAVAEAAVPEEETHHIPGSNSVDPHLWMNVGFWARLPEVIADAIAELRPECAEALEARAERYAEELRALDGWVRASIATIPASQRVLVTAHDAFGYYSRAYGIEVASIQGISTQAEASLADVMDTVETVVARRVPAIFVESSINPRTIEAVLGAARAQGLETRVGGQLYSDAMGTAGTADGTYIGMLYHNTETITEALGGEVPPLPEALSIWTERWKL
jgi:manganese/zinc/iron transport system substrate-binding protein